MNKHQDFFSKSQTKTGFQSGVIRNPKQKSNTGLRIAMILCLIIGGAAAIYLYTNNLFNKPLEISSPELQTGYSIGSEVQVEGALKEENSDLISYTHSLTTSNNELFYLKSRQLSLNNYSNNLSGVFQILGKVESIINGIPLVEVNSIGIATTQATENASGTLQNQSVNNPGIYVAKAGLYFGQDFFDNFAFVGNAGENNNIVIKNLENGKITKINFFTCTTSGDSSCQELIKTFKNNSSKTTTNHDGTAFYRLTEVNSRFFQNNNRRGYFINDAEDSEVESIINLITLPNPDYIKQLVSLYGVKTCLGLDSGLNTITSHTLQKNNNGIQITMQGKGEKEFTCQALVDLTQSTKMKLIDLQTQEATTQT